MLVSVQVDLQTGVAPEELPTAHGESKPQEDPASFRRSGSGVAQGVHHVEDDAHCDNIRLEVCARSLEVQRERGLSFAQKGHSASHEQELMNMLRDCPAWCPVSREALRVVLRQCLGALPVKKELWRIAWAENRKALMYGIQDICMQEPSSMDSALDALRGAADVSEALHLCDNSAFKVDFALVAHNKGVISFSEWMSSAVAREGGEEVACECMVLAAERFEGQEGTRSSKMGSEILLPLTKSFEGFQHKTAELRAASERLRSASRGRLLGGAGPAGGPPAPVGDVGKVGAGVAGAGATGGTAPGAPVGDAAQQQGQAQQSALFAPDIEEEANSHFQRIYTNKLQIEGVIQMLKGFKTSSNQVRNCYELHFTSSQNADIGVACAEGARSVCLYDPQLVRRVQILSEIS